MPSNDGLFTLPFYRMMEHLLHNVLFLCYREVFFMSIAMNLTVNRLPRDRDNTFTMIPNSILRDNTLSLKAKSVLFYLIGERDNSCSIEDGEDGWVMTIRGLTSKFKESVGSIKRALDELMQRGYLVRTDILNDRNLRIRSEYTVYEQPIDNPDGKPIRRYENDANNNTMEQNKQDELSADQEACEAVLKHNVDFNTLEEDYGDYAQRVVSLMSKIIAEKRSIWVGKRYINPERATKAFYALDYDSVSDVIERIKERPDIKKWDKYVITSLYKAGQKLTPISYGSIALCISMMKGLIDAKKNNNLESWWNENRNSFSNFEFEVMKQYIYDTFHMDQFAYMYLVSNLYDFN